MLSETRDAHGVQAIQYLHLERVCVAVARHAAAKIAHIFADGVVNFKIVSHFKDAGLYYFINCRKTFSLSSHTDK